MLAPNSARSPIPKKPMPPVQTRRRRAARSALVLGLLAGWTFPATAPAAPRLHCQVEQGGTSQSLEFAPVADC